MDITQAKKTCSNCNEKFYVSWWSNRSRVAAMKIEICPVCEVELHPNGILAQWQAAQQNAHPTLGKSATSQAVSNAETLSTSDGVPPSAPARVA